MVDESQVPPVGPSSPACSMGQQFQQGGDCGEGGSGPGLSEGPALPREGAVVSGLQERPCRVEGRLG